MRFPDYSILHIRKRHRPESTVRSRLFGTALLVGLTGCIATAMPLAAAADIQPGASVEDEENPHVWKPKTKSVAVFKNGLGFFTREATVHLRDGWAYGRDVPPAAFGTLAVYAHSDRQSVDLVGAGAGEVVVFDGHDADRDLATVRQRLESQVGLKVELHSQRLGAERSAAGLLVAVGPEYAVLEADSQTLAVPLKQIVRMQVLDMPLRVHVRQEDEGEASEARLGIGYLRQGIMWIPEYTLNLVDDTTAELTLRGTLVNEAEDLVHCDVNFVVGVPHFVHSDLLSPVAVGRMIRTLGSVAGPAGVPQQVMSQMMNRAAIANNSFTRGPDSESGTPSTQPVPAESDDLSDLLRGLPQLEGPASSDFTVYTKEDLTVRRGERAIVTLFTKRIHYDHLYRWEVPQRVEHFLTLENTTSTAWTTGPCLTLAKGNPLSEDVLRYTPRGGQGELQVTTAINIAHARSEEEVDRELKAHEPRNNEYFDLVTLAGEIRLKNFQEEQAEIAVELPIEGRPMAADEAGTIHIDATKLRLIEQAGSIRWRLRLEPGKTRVLTYRFQKYVSSN